MITRILALTAGLSGAAGLSQFPEFSQQYAQRLGGAVDELHQFVADFDADAARLGFTRDQALVQLAQGGEIGAARATTMSKTIDRYESLNEAIGELQNAGPFMRAYRSSQINDLEIIQAAWADFKPAVPLTFAGLIFSGVGFFLGFIGVSMIFGTLRMLFRRRNTAEGGA